MKDQASGLRDLVAKYAQSNSKFITIASGKGGVGKTNFAVNFAYLLANRFGKKILLIDADIGMANIHLFLHLKPYKSIKNFYLGEALEEIIQQAYGFDVLLGFSGIDDFDELDDASLQVLIHQLEALSQKYDYIIIDTGAGIDEKVASFLRASHKTYIITTPEPPALMDAYALIKSMYKIYGYENFKVIINMAKNKEEGEITFNKLKVSVKKFLDLDLQLLGILPFTKNLHYAVKKKELIVTLFPKDSYVQELFHICQKELALKESRSHVGFWHKLFDYIGKRS